MTKRQTKNAKTDRMPKCDPIFSANLIDLERNNAKVAGNAHKACDWMKYGVRLAVLACANKGHDRTNREKNVDGEIKNLSPSFGDRTLHCFQRINDLAQSPKPCKIIHELIVCEAESAHKSLVLLRALVIWGTCLATLFVWVRPMEMVREN